MGDLCQPTTSETPGYQDVLTNTNIPQWASQGGQELFEQAKNLATQPYQQYTGPRVASFTDDENTAFDTVRQGIGGYQPFMDQAQTSMNQAATQWGNAPAQQYMDPYQQNVTDIAAREYNRNADIRQAGNRSAATLGAGGFGGSRQGVVEGATERARALGLSDMYAKGQANSYANAQQMFNADQNRALQTGQLGASLGAANQQLGVQDAAALERVGAAQRALNQRSLDTGYQDFQEQRDNPYKQTNFAIGALKGVPYNTSEYRSQDFVNPQLSSSPLGQAAGALTGLVGAYQLYGNGG